MRWGLLPHWAKDEKLSFSTFNARSEEFRTKPAFKDAWRRGQRCLVITNGYYEWKKLDAAGKRKQPYAIRHGGRQRDGARGPVVVLALADERRRNPKLYGIHVRAERLIG